MGDPWWIEDVDAARALAKKWETKYKSVSKNRDAWFITAIVGWAVVGAILGTVFAGVIGR